MIELGLSIKILHHQINLFRREWLRDRELRRPWGATAATLTTHPPATPAEATPPAEAAASLQSEHTDEEEEEDIAVRCDDG